MTKKKFGTKSIALMGVLIAVVVVFSRFFAYETTFLKNQFHVYSRIIDWDDFRTFLGWNRHGGG